MSVPYQFSRMITDRARYHCCVILLWVITFKLASLSVAVHTHNGSNNIILKLVRALLSPSAVFILPTINDEIGCACVCVYIINFLSAYTSSKAWLCDKHLPLNDINTGASFGSLLACLLAVFLLGDKFKNFLKRIK